RSTQQIANWEKAVLTDVEKQIDNRVKHKPGPHYLYYKQFRYVGTTKDIAPRIARPAWDKAGESARFDVDHKLEYQLGGDDTTPADNLWLLDSSANRSAGSTIRAEIAKQRDGLIAAARPHLTPKPKPQTILKNYTFTVKKLLPGSDPKGAKTFWTAAEAKTDKIAEPLKPVSEKEIEKLRGSPSLLTIFSHAHGGRYRSLPLKGNTAPAKDWGR